MKRNALAKKLRKPLSHVLNRIILAGSLVLALILIGLLLHKHFSLQTTKPAPLTLSSPDEPNSPTSNSVPTTSTIKQYTSTDLGVSFNYPDDFSVAEVGNKIYLYTGTQFDDGLSLEVFAKDPAETLALAIKNRFLQGSALTNCEVRIVDSLIDPGIKNAPHNPAYQYAVIRAINFDKYTGYQQREGICPIPYSYVGNGTVYFLADTTHPKRFLFLNIGQSGILAGGGLDYAWQGTIRFLDL